MHLLSSRSLRASFLLLVGAVAILALACGSDDSPDEPVATPEATAEAVTATATQAPTEAPATETADAGGSVDENYLRAICMGGNDLQAAMFMAAIRLETEGGDPDDPEVFVELFVAPLAGFLEHMREVTPPDDLAEYHTAALAQYEALVTLFAAIGRGAKSWKATRSNCSAGCWQGPKSSPSCRRLRSRVLPRSRRASPSAPDRSS